MRAMAYAIETPPGQLDTRKGETMEKNTERRPAMMHSALQKGCARWTPILPPSTVPAQKTGGDGKAVRDPVADPRHAVETPSE